MTQSVRIASLWIAIAGVAAGEKILVGLSHNHVPTNPVTSQHGERSPTERALNVSRW